MRRTISVSAPRRHRHSGTAARSPSARTRCCGSCPRWSRRARTAGDRAIIRGVESGRRYNAAETFIDAHRGVRADRIAIRCQGASVTYGELAANVDRAGNALRDLGVQMEQRIVLQVIDSPAFVYAFFGAIKIGAIPVPTNTLLTSRDLRYILEDTRAVAIVVSAPLLPKVLELRTELPRLKHVLVTGSPAQD